MNLNYLVWAGMAVIVVYAIRLAIFFVRDAFEDIDN